MNAKKRSLVLIFSVMFFLLLVSFFFDNPMVRLMQQSYHPAADYAADWLGHLGSLAAVLIIMTTLFLWEEKKKRWIPALWLSILSTFITVHLIKLFVHRPRPLGLIQLIPYTHWIDYSFPSGHAAVAFATVPILNKEFPKLRWFWITFACLIAASRVYQNLHYCTDIIAGMIIGYGFGLLFVYLKDKHKLFERVRLWKRY